MLAENLYGLIGKTLTHSFSKKYFTEKFEREQLHHCKFELFPLSSIRELHGVLHQHENLKGLSVTIPYKEQVIELLDEINEEAEMVGAVNCLKIDKGKLFGFNTDIYGFEQTLTDFIALAEKTSSKKFIPNALILGTGGASKAVAWVLHKMGITFMFVSRSEGKGRLYYHELTKQLLSEFGLIVNTTPLGTFPDVYSCPDIPYEMLDNRHFVYDLVYNPDPTLFLQKAKAQGCPVHNGLKMLHLQADKAWSIWNESS
jgi:shikimate dehydrogenase